MTPQMTSSPRHSRICWLKDCIEAVLASHGKPYRVIGGTEMTWLLPIGAYAAARECESEIALAIGAAEVMVWGVKGEAGMMTVIEVAR